MAGQAKKLDNEMDHAGIPGTSLQVSRITLGTWAIGGWMWGGTDETESIATIQAAIDHGITVIDTAPAYGFGRSEEIVGRALAEGRLRSHVLIATKTGLEWEHGNVFRNASRARILYEIEESMRRLQTDHIDIYQVHWPDPLDANRADLALFKQRAHGLGGFLDRCQRRAESAAFAPPRSCWTRGSRRHSGVHVIPPSCCRLTR
jgi:aryl-alcohol dehydrogenase-like predicted oxidoreductase